jgi:DNA modification methylase
MKSFLTITDVPVASIRPYPNSPRVHSKAQRKKAKKLIQHHGVATPLLVDANHQIIDGHLRWEVAQELGLETLPCVIIPSRNEANNRDLRLAINKLPEDTRWDREKLFIELSSLVEIKYDLELTGHDQGAIEIILDYEPTPRNVVEDAPLPIPDRPAVTKPGDLWLLGPHRLRQGDACNPDDVADVVGDAKVRVVFADFPYNCRIGGFVSGLGQPKHREFPQASGEMSAEEFFRFKKRCLEVLINHLIDGAIIYACMDWRNIRSLISAGEALGLDLKNICVWAKTAAGMGTFYRSQHELIAVFKYGTAEHINNFELGQYGRSRTNLWSYRGMTGFSKDRKDLLKVHPTVKPQIMVADAIRDVSKRGDVVFDPFSGSGTTLMAAHETGRVCCTIELDPLYVDAAILRWQAATGIDAVLAATGETFDEIAARQAEARVSAGDDGTMAPQTSPSALSDLESSQT